MWKNYFKLPLSNDDLCSIYVRDSNRRVVFNWLKELNEEERLEIVNKLNGNGKKKFNASRDNVHILIDDSPIFLVRGWGYLTGHGIGGLGLQPQEAIEIQDSLLEWVIEKLGE